MKMPFATRNSTSLNSVAEVKSDLLLLALALREVDRMASIVGTQGWPTTRAVLW